MSADMPVPATPPKVTDVEVHGVEPIPDAERTARPLDLFRLTFGGANTIATVVLGSFPIIFGLSFRDALVATLLGVSSARRSWPRWRCSARATAPTTRSRPRRTSACTAGSSARSCRC